MKITKLKHQLYIFLTLIAFILFIFIWITYYLYNNEYKKDINNHIQNEVSLHKKEIVTSIKSAKDKLKTQRDFFKSIHLKVIDILKENPNLDLHQLQSDIKEKYLSAHIDIELYLIDKSYTIYNTTYEKDLGFNLSIVTEAKQFLDKTTADGKVYISDFLSTDALDTKYKLYSYSKLNDKSYLELGFVNDTLNNTIELLTKNSISNKTKVTLYGVSKDDKQYYYYPLKEKSHIKSKEEYYTTLIKIPLNESTDDHIINSVKFGSQIHLTNQNIHTIYTKVFDESIFNILGFENIVLELNIDVTEKIKFIQYYTNILITSLILIAILLIIMVIFIKSRFTNPIEKILDSIKKSKKVDSEEIISFNNELSKISKSYNELLDKLEKENELNKKLTLIDSLTNAYNRKAYDTNMKKILSLFNRYKTPFSIILCDIDDFKKINDTFGHSIGDDVLKSLVKLATSNMRKTDSFYRVGGEEFIIICDNTVELDAVSVAEKLRKTVESSLRDKNITLSIGVTEVMENDTEDSIYKRVDDNLYHSKNNGKNRVTSNIDM